MARVLIFLLPTLLLALPRSNAQSGPAPSPAPGGADDAWVAAQNEDLVDFYQRLHTHPELSYQEVQTAATVAEALSKAGAKVTTGVGKLGVVGILENGPGPVVMVRTDMDALPVVEKTGLPYASKVQARDNQGREVGVMHACGHDMHMTCF